MFAVSTSDSVQGQGLENVLTEQGFKMAKAE
jgi:hypothetical protein